MGVNWNNLLATGRCKAIGVPWSDEEHKALYELKIPPDYVRGGCLTLEEYEKAKAAPEKAQKYRSKSEIQSEAKALGIEFSDETTRPELIELVQLKKESKEKSNHPASA